MPRKSKPDISRFERSGRGRKVGVRSIRQYYLIVCEGEETEPNYFRAFIGRLPQGVLQVCKFDVKGLGTNTSDLVEKASELAEEVGARSGRKVDRIWCVFDKDSFPDNQFNAAIEACNNTEDMAAAFSNEAFELWYLLHFHYVNTGMRRVQYQKKLSEYMTKASGKKTRYEKNSPDNYRLMTELGSLDDAIRNAEKLESRYGDDRDYAAQNPRTAVHRLIKELQELGER
jgi:hypothetical protein